jgi:hypothetical protein
VPRSSSSRLHEIIVPLLRCCLQGGTPREARSSELPSPAGVRTIWAP